MDLQQVIRKKLEVTGWSRCEFARRAGLTRSAVTRMLQRKNPSPPMQTLEMVWPVLYGSEFEFPKLPEEETCPAQEEP